MGSGGALSSNNQLGEIDLCGDDGSGGSAAAFSCGANIIATVQASPGAGLMPSRLDFSTGNTTGGLTDALRIDDAQHLIFEGKTPAVLSGSTDCGTSPAIIGAHDNVGRVQVGTGTNGGKCTITFANPWTSQPVCVVQDETTPANPVYPVYTGLTALVITALIFSK